MSKEDTQATDQQKNENQLLRSLGVLFNQQSNAHNAKVAALVEMVVALRGHMEEQKILPYNAEGTRLYEADDAEVVKVCDELHAHITKQVREDVELDESQDVMAVMSNVGLSFRRALTIIGYLSDMPVPTKYVYVDILSLGVVNEMQMQYAQMQQNGEMGEVDVEDTIAADEE